MKYVIAGTGAIGLALMDELHQMDAEILLLNRHGSVAEKIPDGVAIQPCDLTDPTALTAACQDCSVLIHAAGSSGAAQLEYLPALLDSFIQTASASNCSLLYIDTMEAYGDNSGIPLSEATPERPSSPLEILRSQLARTLQEASQKKLIRMCIARACDIYGPRVTKAPLGEAVFMPLVAGKAVQMLGRLDMPHSYLFVRDLARSVIRLLDNETAWGHVWHIPSPQPITQQQIIDILGTMCRRNIKIKTLNSAMGGLKNLINPEFKAIRESLYRFENPWVVNHSRFATTFGERVTSHEQALFETLEWYRRRAGIVRRYGF